jgi:hypothetical protein
VVFVFELKRKPNTCNEATVKFNRDAVVFVFELKRKPHTCKAVYFEDAGTLANDKDYRHIGTLNPAAWIEYLLNHPKLRAAHIADLRAKPVARARTGAS